MPSAAKAILDPFSPLTVSEALLVAVCGMVVVFMMLAILALVIIIISKIVNSVESKAVHAAAPAKSAAPAPAPKPAAPAAPAVDEGELVAVMMAAVAEESGMNPNSFRITNIAAAPAAAAPVAAAPVAPAAAPAPAPAAAPVAGQPAQAEEGEYIKAPLVGTFYTAAGPDAAPFVQVGDKVQKGQTVCILEAMKAMSEIPAPMDCVIEEVLLDNGSLAAFDAPLFRVRRL